MDGSVYFRHLRGSRKTVVGLEELDVREVQMGNAQCEQLMVWRSRFRLHVNFVDVGNVSVYGGCSL